MEEEGKNPTEAFIRVGVKGGGCSGLSYELSFDTDLKDTDKVFEDNGMKVVVDKKSFLYLVGTEKVLFSIIRMLLAPAVAEKVFQSNFLIG